MSNPWFNPRATWQRAAGEVALVPAGQPIATTEYLHPYYATPGYSVRDYGPYHAPYPSGMVRYGDKPRGFQIVHTTEQPPKNPPDADTVGGWITVDGGWGSPPVYGFLARETGLEKTEAQKPSGAAGHYVLVEMAGKTAWVWVPLIDQSYGK